MGKILAVQHDDLSDSENLHDGRRDSIPTSAHSPDVHTGHEVRNTHRNQYLKDYNVSSKLET